MPREVWSAIIASSVRRELVAQVADPLDLVTLASRVREMIRVLIRSRGRPPRVEPAGGYPARAFRVVVDRLEAVFTITARRKRSWWRPWRVREDGRINVLELHLYPLRAAG